MVTSDLRHKTQVRSLRPRFLVAVGLVIFAFLLLVTRLYTLQIIRGEELSSKGQRNFVQEVRVPHDRGIIYDRYGRIIVDNRPSLDAQVTPAFLGKKQEAEVTLARLAELVNLKEEDLARVRSSVFKQRSADRFQPILVKRDLSPGEVEAIESDRAIFKLDGVDIVEGRRRNYRYGATAAHLLGYVNEIDPDTLDAERKKGNPRLYVLGDAIGRAGVEKSYEGDLRGSDGFEQVVVDAKGRRQHDDYFADLLGKERRVEPVPGHNIYLTIDLDLQQRAEAAFHGKSGAVVALDPHTGAILAMASVPAYDPNLVAGAIAKDVKRALDTDPLKPWLNRPIQGQYAPGSTYKIVTAMAALKGRTSPHESVYCPGHYTFGNRAWRCHKDSGHGSVDLRVALMKSCDTYFYSMGVRLGIDAVAEMGRTLGFGQKTGVPLADEKAGIVPDVAYHNRADAKTGGYQKGMALNTAIGQGSVLVTPIQQALAYSVVANGGTVYKPQLVDHIETADFRVRKRYLPQARRWQEGRVELELFEGSPLSDDGARSVEALASLVREEVVGAPPTLLKPWQPVVLRHVDLDPADVKEVHNGLVAVTSDPGGTAYYRRSKVVSMAGKTGTAQVVHLGRDRLKPQEVDYFHRDHAWFVAYAPTAEPDIVVAVLNEHSGHGGSEAAPIAVAVIDAFYELKHGPVAQAAITAEQGR